MTRGVPLRQAARDFSHHPSPRMLAVALLVSVVARALAGPLGLGDLLVLLGLTVVFPFVEWIVHVVVLHWRPRRLAGMTIDPLLARKHRAHHLDPRDEALIFIPIQSLVGAAVSATAAALWLFPRPSVGLTFLALTFGIGLLYEWTHYLVHTDYTPRAATYRFIWRNHRRHHFKNEHYWFAVTTPGTADRCLGTYPDPDAVTTSPTARNLHALSR